MRLHPLPFLTLFFAVIFTVTIPRSLQAQEEITTKTIMGVNGNKPMDIVEYYRRGVKIMAVSSPNPENRFYQVYYQGQVIASLAFTSQGILKQSILGNQMAREMAIQWFDKNSDGYDDYLLISTADDPKLIEAFSISIEDGLVPVPSSKFETLLTPRAMPVAPIKPIPTGPPAY